MLVTVEGNAGVTPLPPEDLESGDGDSDGDPEHNPDDETDPNPDDDTDPNPDDDTDPEPNPDDEENPEPDPDDSDPEPNPGDDDDPAPDPDDEGDPTPEPGDDDDPAPDPGDDDDPVPDPDEDEDPVPEPGPWIPFDPYLSTMSSQYHRIPADGVSSTRITVDLADEDFARVYPEGWPLELSSEYGTFIDYVDTGYGMYEATLVSDTTPAITVITASMNGIQLEQTLTVEFMDPDEMSAHMELRGVSLIDRYGEFAYQVHLDSSGTRTPWDLARQQLWFDDGSDLEYSGGNTRLSNIFDEPGNYTIELVVTDLSGATAETQLEIQLDESVGFWSWDYQNPALLIGEQYWWWDTEQPLWPGPDGTLQFGYLSGWSGQMVMGEVVLGDKVNLMLPVTDTTDVDSQHEMTVPGDGGHYIVHWHLDSNGSVSQDRFLSFVPGPGTVSPPWTIVIPYVQQATDLAASPDGGVVIAGYSSFIAEGSYHEDAWLAAARVSAAGELLWEYSFDTAEVPGGAVHLPEATFDSDGVLYLVDHAVVPELVDEEQYLWIYRHVAMLAAVDAGGSELWRQSIHLYDYDPNAWENEYPMNMTTVYDLAVSGDALYVLTGIPGQHDSYGPARSWLFAHDSRTGEELWQNILGQPSGEFVTPMSLIPVDSNEVVAVLWSDSETYVEQRGWNLLERVVVARFGPDQPEPIDHQDFVYTQFEHCDHGGRPLGAALPGDGYLYIMSGLADLNATGYQPCPSLISNEYPLLWRYELDW